MIIVPTAWGYWKKESSGIMNAEPFGTDLEQKELKYEGWGSVQRARSLNVNYGLGGRTA